MLPKTEDDLVLYALKNPPSLILDCADSANPHRYFPYVSYENYKQTYVISVDTIYRFRDTLKQAGSIAAKLGVKRIIITSYRYLFNYQDDCENADVLSTLS